ncbi:MAG: TetR family transcriptional regulator [Deltaproteobacteria bacterium]|nr:TetR family transcriptional regulator [Deltaproteobacteria bacterium]MCB9786826.1 TetR family transcriptional regulator [Deltaproteobacteria bacterium]
MARIKGRTASATRQEALAAAIQIFASRGYEGTSLANIASEIGVTAAAIAYHFGGKAQLYQAAIDRVYADLAALRDEVGPGMPLTDLIAITWDFVAARRDHMRLLLRNIVDSGGVGDELRVRQMGPTLDLVSTLLGAALKVPPLRARRLISALTHLVLRFATNAEADNRVALGTTSDAETRAAIIGILTTVAESLIARDIAT